MKFFKKKRDVTTKEIINDDTKTYHVYGNEKTKEIDGVREKFGVQIYSAESDKKIAETVEETVEETASLTEEAKIETEQTEEFYDIDDEYEYVTPSYFKNAFILGLICVLVGAVISFFVFKNKMAADIKTAYEQNGYMLTNGCTATAADIKEGKTAYIRGQLVTGTLRDIDTTNATATAADILKGYTAYVNGQLVTGTIPTYNGLTTIVPSATDYKISKGVYIVDDLVIKGEPNLISSNIKNGISIFGVRGSYVIEEPTNE
ncbi:MAG: hypothetical protein GX914_07080 [Erysipelotrichia bacterium]|nr:hypothetical protein [Erysipelotrichia bacterium]